MKRLLSRRQQKRVAKALKLDVLEVEESVVGDQCGSDSDILHLADEGAASSFSGDSERLRSLAADSDVNCEVDDDFRALIADECPANCRASGSNGSRPSSPSAENIAAETANVFSFETFQHSMAKLIIEEKISQKSTNKILQLLRIVPALTDLPKDARTLIKTPKDATKLIRAVHPGHYYHCGLVRSLRTEIDRQHLNSSQILLLKIGCDGLPLAQSNPSELWPILGMLTTPESRVFPIGLYHGRAKPADSNEFLSDFVDELIPVVTSGLEHKGAHYTVRLHAVICDAPAKSFVCGLVGHTGYYSCTKCVTKGKNIKNRVYFDNLTAPLRNHTNFIEKKQPQHHTKETILSEVPHFDLVKGVPLDYMHLVCLGVMKRLLTLWIPTLNKNKNKTPCNTKHKINSRVVSNLCGILVSFEKWNPKEFVRKPRSLMEVTRWKATELRQFLLYTGPLLLREAWPGKWDDIVYKHFLSLHVAIRILASPTLLKKYGLFAGKLLHHFVKYFGPLYSKKFITHNVHGLIHLYDDCRTYGSLDTFSAFPFESHLHYLKKDLKKYEKPLEQIINRTEERWNNDVELMGSSRAKELGITLVPGCTYLLKSGEIVVLKKKCDDGILYVNPFKICEPMFTEPCHSTLVGVYSVQCLDTRCAVTTAADAIKTKCARYPFPFESDRYMVAEFLH